MRLTLPAVPDSVPRSGALNVLTAIPQRFVLVAYFIGGAAVAVIGWFAVMFTATWPTDIRDFRAGSTTSPCEYGHTSR